MKTLQYILENLWSQQKVVIILLFVSFSVGIVRYKNLFQPDKLFLLIIFLSLSTELIAIYAGFFTLYNNFFCYNLLTIISFPIYLFYFKKLNIKFPFSLLFTLLFLANLYSIFFEDFWKEIYSVSPLIGAIVIVICVFYSFSHLLKERQLENLFKNATFLFLSGLMIFHLGIIPYFFLHKYLQLSRTYADIIIIVLNIILYSFYILALLCSKRKTY